MTVLASHLLRDDAFANRAARMEALVAQLRERTAPTATRRSTGSLPHSPRRPSAA